MQCIIVIKIILRKEVILSKYFSVKTKNKYRFNKSLSMSSQHGPSQHEGNRNKRPHDELTKSPNEARPRAEVTPQGGQQDANGEETTLEVLQWVCEICEVATFNTFKEACEHELKCVQRNVNGPKRQKKEDAPETKPNVNYETANDNTISAARPSAPTPTPAPAPAPAPVSDTVTTEAGDLSMQWVCECCNNALFRTYAEACEHEKLCREKHNKGLDTSKKVIPMGPTSDQSIREPQPNTSLDHSNSNIIQKSSKRPIDLNESGHNEQSAGVDENDEVTHWVCEFCRKAVFDSYEKAVEHEAICKFAPQNRDSKPLASKEKNDFENPPQAPNRLSKESNFMGDSVRKSSPQTHGSNKEIQTETDNDSPSESDPENKTHVVRWVCEICEEAAFDTYIEACRHEMICKKRKKTTEKEPSLAKPDSVQSNVKDTEMKAHLTNNGMKTKMNDDNESKNGNTSDHHQHLSKSALHTSNVNNNTINRSNQIPQHERNNSNTNMQQVPNYASHISNGIGNTLNRLQQVPKFGTHIPNGNINHFISSLNYANPMGNSLGNTMNHILPVPRHNHFPNAMNHVISHPNRSRDIMNRVLQVPKSGDQFLENANNNGGLVKHDRQKGSYVDLSDEYSKEQTEAKKEPSKQGIETKTETKMIPGPNSNHTDSSKKAEQNLVSQDTDSSPINHSSEENDNQRINIDALAANEELMKHARFLHGVATSSRMLGNSSVRATLDQNNEGKNSNPESSLLNEPNQNKKQTQAEGKESAKNENSLSDASKNGNKNITRITLPPMDRNSLLNPDGDSNAINKGFRNVKNTNVSLRLSQDNDPSDPSKKKNDESYRWLCESCETAIFQTYTEAAEHEAICRKAKATRDETKQNI